MSVTTQTDLLWPLTGKILLTLAHLFMAVVACAMGGGSAHEAIQFQDYFPHLWVALATAVLGFYALAMVFSIWNDVPAVYRSIGVVSLLGGVYLLSLTYSEFNVAPEEYRSATGIVGFTIACGLILTAVSMVWWNQMHATIFCRYRMHLGGVLLNVLIAAGTFWALTTRQPRGHMDMSGIVFVLFLIVQGVWLVILIAATLMFPRQPRNAEGQATSCHV